MFDDFKNGDGILRMKCLLIITGALILLGLIASVAYADTRVLDDSASRADIASDSYSGQFGQLK